MDQQQTLFHRAGIPRRIAHVEYVPVIAGSTQDEVHALTHLWNGLVTDPKQLRDFPFRYVFLATLQPVAGTPINHMPSTALGVFPIMKAAVLHEMKVLCLDAEQLPDFSRLYQKAKNPEIVMVYGLTRDAYALRRHLNRVMLSNSHVFICYDDELASFGLVNHPVNFTWQFSSVNMYQNIQTS